jgi:hypothetical protein
MKALDPLVGRDRSLEKQGPYDVVNGTNGVLNFTVLRGGVWAGHTEEGASSEEEGAHGGVVKFPPIVTLDSLNRGPKLSSNISKECHDCINSVRFEAQRKGP